jgi:hypothetical protein
MTWPGLTEDAIHKHMKLTLATAMGHMNQRRQNIRSTSKTHFEDVPTTAIHGPDMSWSDTFMTATMLRSSQ